MHITIREKTFRFVKSDGYECDCDNCDINNGANGVACEEVNCLSGYYILVKAMSKEELENIIISEAKTKLTQYASDEHLRNEVLDFAKAILNVPELIEKHNLKKL